MLQAGLIRNPVNRSVSALLRWFDNEAGTPLQDDPESRKVDLLRTAPFLLLHLSCLSIFWVGWSPFAVATALVLYGLRMFAITGFYHRYFSHRAFRTHRLLQFLFAVLGASAVQRGPLWWASHHRHHHIHSDQKEDVHSPLQQGFLWSHLGWFLCRLNFQTRRELVRDWMRYPELCLLDRYDTLVPIATGLGLYGLGEWLAAIRPDWGTNGLQLFIWGFSISTVLLYHATFTVNSLAHLWGRRRFETRDSSRNNLLIALITLGEGWHNNHHRYPSSVRQGFYWWEIDPTYYLLRLMAALGLIWDLRPLPSRLRGSRYPTTEARS